VFLQNMKNLSGGDKQFAENIMSDLQDANFDSISLSFLNASFQDIKKKIVAQFKNGRINQPAILLFLKKYVSTFDSNHDGVRDVVAASPTNAANAGAAVATPVEDDSAFLYASIIKEIGQSQSLKDAVMKFARDNQIVSKIAEHTTSLKNKMSDKLKRIIKFIADQKTGKGDTQRQQT
jgi:hypothetical protein